MRYLAAMLTGSALVIPPAGAQSPPPRDDLWVPNGQVYHARQQGDLVYLSGDFTQVGPVTGAFLQTDAQTGQFSPNWPKIDGLVRAVIDDGQGGWYVGGDFSWVDDQPRSGAIRIDAGGTVLPWDAGFVGQNNVRAIAKVDDHVYILNGSNILMRVDAETGQPTAWSPDINGGVATMVVAGGSLVIAGDFNAVDLQPRASIAFFDASSGALRPWNPELIGGGGFGALADDGSTLYAWGSIRSPTSPPQTGPRRILGFDLGTGEPTGLDIDTESIFLRDMMFHDGWLYLGGRFEFLHGAPRDGLARLDPATGQLDAWAPSIGKNDPANPPSVGSINAIGDTLWFGGQFQSVMGQPRNRAAAVDIDTLALKPWDPRVGDPRSDLYVVPRAAGVAVAGEFSIAGAVPRTTLAAIDLKTGEANEFAPFSSGVPRNGPAAPALPMGDLVIGPREPGGTGLALFDAATGARQPGTYGSVITLAQDLILVNDELIAWSGGLVVLEAASGKFLWGLDGAGQASKIVPSPDGRYLYVAGALSIGGQNRPGFVEIDLLRRRVTNWNPQMNGQVKDVLVADDRVILLGSFETVEGQARRGIALFDLIDDDTRLLAYSSLVLNSGGVAQAASYGRIMYMNGSFGAVSSITRQGVAAVDAFSGAVCDWTVPETFGHSFMINRVLPVGVVFSSEHQTRYGEYYRPYMAVFAVEDVPCQ